MTSRTAFALFLAAAVAAGAAYKFLPRGNNVAPADDHAAQAPGAVDSGRDSLTPVAPDRSESGAATSDRRDAAPDLVGASRDEPSKRRKVTESEKESVRELMKQRGALDSGSNRIEASSVPAELPGTDPDSLFLKYGSFDKQRLKEALESLQAILDWQNEGPFEAKELEILPPDVVRTFEIEIEWLQEQLAAK